LLSKNPALADQSKKWLRAINLLPQETFKNMLTRPVGDIQDFVPSIASATSIEGNVQSISDATETSETAGVVNVDLVATKIQVSDDKQSTSISDKPTKIIEQRLGEAGLAPTQVSEASAEFVMDASCGNPASHEASHATVSTSASPEVLGPDAVTSTEFAMPGDLAGLFQAFLRMTQNPGLREQLVRLAAAQSSPLASQRSAATKITAATTPVPFIKARSLTSVSSTAMLGSESSVSVVSAVADDPILEEGHVVGPTLPDTSDEEIDKQEPAMPAVPVRHEMPAWRAVHSLPAVPAWRAGHAPDRVPHLHSGEDFWSRVGR
jgi:hypothetical protein